MLFLDKFLVVLVIQLYYLVEFFHSFDNNIFDIRKTVLKGKYMENCVIPDNFSENLLRLFDTNTSGDDECQIICKDPTDKNKYITGLIKHIEKLSNKVSVINYVDNNKYDELLSKNIVFLNLIDCSAVNTIIECIVRNTPVLVNKLPAIVEVLGDKYPFYYNNLDDIENKINNYRKFWITTSYLKNLDKEKFKIEYFMNSIKNVLIWTLNIK